MDAPKGKDAARDFTRRPRKGAGADPTATGATRLAGSLNFKTKYAPAFPCVDIIHTNAGKMTRCAELGVWGFMAAPDPQPPASVPQIKPPGPALNRKWPDYQ